MIIHYNCTIGSILLDSFLLIYHPYPPSFHEMIFILVKLQAANTVFEKTPLPCHEAYSAGARSVLMRMRIHVFAHACVMYARISIFGAPWHSSFATTKIKISGTSIKIGNEGG